MTAGAKPYTMKVVRTVFNGGHEETYGNATRLVPTQHGYCWSFYFHATLLLSLCRILHAPEPAKTAYVKRHLRHFGVDQQYRDVLWGVSHLLHGLLS